MSNYGQRFNLTDDNGNHIYYTLKLDNIYDGDEGPINANVRDDTSIIVSKQSDYKMAIHSFSLNIRLPVSIFPIKEGTQDVATATINAITQANPAVITTAAPHGLIVGEPVFIENIVGMSDIGGDYFVNTVPAPNQFTLRTINNVIVDSTNYGVYISGGDVFQYNNNINLSDLGFCITIGGIDYTRDILYIGDYNTVASPNIIPKSPRENGGIQDNSTGYYFMYSFEQLCNILNQNLASLFATLPAPDQATLVEPPFFEYGIQNPDRISLVFPYTWIGNAQLFCNELLIQYLAGFRTIFYGFDQPNFKDFEFLIESRNGTNSFSLDGGTIPAPPDYIIFTQEFDGRYRFNKIQSIVLFSDHIKIRPEYYPKTGNPNAFSSIGKSSNDFNTSALNILATFDIIDQEGQVSWRQVQHYQPHFYRWMDLVSNDSLQKMDVRIFYITNKGELIQAQIPANSSSNIKFIFRRKELAD